MEILLNALGKVHNLFIAKDIYWIIFWAIIAFIIGWLVLKSIEKDRQAQKAVDELARFRLKEAIINASPAQIAKAFGSFKTINVYWSKKMHIDLHKKMIRYIQTHLEIEGLKLSMTPIDCELMKTWVNPVLVIYPEKGLYFFHPDQNESRSSSKSFVIETHHVPSLEKAIDNEIALMRGVSND